MAEGKKSFVLYSDLLPTIRKLIEKDRIKQTNNTGELFLHLLEYVCDNNPEPINDTVDLVFEPIKTQLKRDLNKWEEKSPQRVEKARLAGLASAEARRLKNELNPTNELKNELNPTKPTVSVNANVSVTDILLEKETKLNINDRKKNFYQSLVPFIETYDKLMIRDFYEYWTEHGEKDKKMRFEKQTSFDIKRRLDTWKKNDKKFNNTQNGKSGITTTQKKQPLKSNLAGYFNDNGQAEVSNPEGELFEDTEYTEVE